MHLASLGVGELAGWLAGAQLTLHCAYRDGAYVARLVDVDGVDVATGAASSWLGAIGQAIDRYHADRALSSSARAYLALLAESLLGDTYAAERLRPMWGVLSGGDRTAVEAHLAAHGEPSVVQLHRSLAE